VRALDDLAAAVDEVDDARRQVAALEQADDEPLRQGHLLRGLHDGGIPAENRRERLPGDVRKRRVEAHDQRGDAERLPRREDGSVLHARGRRAAVRTATLSRDEEPHLDGGVRLPARAPPACRLLDDDRRPPRDVRAGEARARARRRRERRPSARPMPVGGARSCHRVVDIGGIGLRYAA
jgi:hypothetical protein